MNDEIIEQLILIPGTSERGFRLFGITGVELLVNFWCQVLILDNCAYSAETCILLYMKQYTGTRVTTVVGNNKLFPTTRISNQPLLTFPQSMEGKYRVFNLDILD